MMSTPRSNEGRPMWRSYSPCASESGGVPSHPRGSFSRQPTSNGAGELLSWAPNAGGGGINRGSGIVNGSNEVITPNSRSNATDSGAGGKGTYRPAVRRAATPVETARAPPPSEFLAGPSTPGRVKGGIRRFEGTYNDRVGEMLTDEWMAKHHQGIGGKRRYEQDPNLKGMACEVVAEEAPMRQPVRLHPKYYSTVAPFYEGPDQTTSTRCNSSPQGRRRIATAGNGDFISQYPQSTPRGPNGGEADSSSLSRPSTQPTRRYAQNRSLDVLNLGQYSPSHLGEKPIRTAMTGPPIFIPAPLPPRKPSSLRRTNSPARVDHDIFGTGWGRSEVVHPHSRGRGDCCPEPVVTPAFLEIPKPATISTSESAPSPMPKRESSFHIGGDDRSSTQVQRRTRASGVYSPGRYKNASSINIFSWN